MNNVSDVVLSGGNVFENEDGLTVISGGFTPVPVTARSFVGWLGSFEVITTLLS